MTTPRAGVPLALRAALGACRRHFASAAAFSAFLNLLYLAPTLYMLQVYDRVVPTRGVTTLVMLTLVFLFAALAIALLDLVRARLLVRTSARLDHLLAGPILTQIMRQAGGQARNSALLREFDTLRQTLSGVGALALFDAPWAPLYIIVCFIVHPALGFMALASCALLAVITWANERATSRALKDANVLAQTSYASIDMTLSAGGMVGALGMREALLNRHLRERSAAATQSISAGLTSAGFLSSTKAVRLLLQSLALGLGALLAVEQQISAGAIFAASLLISRALAPIELVAGGWKNIVQARGAYRSIVQLFERAAPERTPTRLGPPEGAVSLEQAGVLAPGGGRMLIEAMSFALEPGETLGVIGPSGAGKSTLLRAMAGELPLVAGKVRYDGASLDDWPEDQRATLIGYMPQMPVLFRGTIKENIARFQTEFAGAGTLDEAVIEAAKQAGAHEFILRLPQGYDSELGWGGQGLSVGQAQRVALARALFGNPAVLILDEPNANFDAEGEAQLMKLIGELRAKKVTIVFVAHRPAILETADRLLVVRDGRMELMGPRLAVLARLQRGTTPTPPAPSIAAQG